MSWARLDDKFHSHPKLQRARGKANAVAGLYCRSLSYCANMLTDGWVDGFWVSTIASRQEIALTTEVGLWLPVEHDDIFVITDRRDSGRRRLPDVTVMMPAAGFFIEDYVKFNPSKEEVLRKRAAGARADAQSDESAAARSMSAHTPVPSRPVSSSKDDDVGFEDTGWTLKQRLEAASDRERAIAWLESARNPSVRNAPAFAWAGFKAGGWPKASTPDYEWIPPACEECGNLIRDGHTEECSVGVATRLALAEFEEVGT